MTKQEKERAIIKSINEIPSEGYGPYHTFRNICEGIARGMGYIERDQTIFQLDCGYEETVREIFDRMKEKGFLMPSKHGHVYKLAKGV